MADHQPAAAGPHRHVQKGVCTIECVPGRAATGTSLVVITVYHAAGDTVIPVMPKYARRVATDLYQAAGGITVASAIPQSPSSGKAH